MNLRKSVTFDKCTRFWKTDLVWFWHKHVHVWYVFSSPDSKGHVRYCHHFASIVVLFHHLQLICLQNQPYLVKMFIGWSSLKFDFCSNGISKMSEARDLKVPKGYFLYVNVYFSTNYIDFFLCPYKILFIY